MVALPPPEDRAFADVWSALGGELKPSLDVVVIAPVDTGVLFPAGPPVRWFGGPGVLLCDHGETWLWVRALTPEAIDTVRHRIPVEWIMS